MTKFNAGDMARYLGGDDNSDLTIGKIYEVSIDTFGDLCINDDVNDDWYVDNYDENFELVTEPSEPTPVEASPTVIELLANLSRRLYEAEKEITELNEKQAIFFDIDKLLKIRIFDLERQNRVQAYEINELYKEVADRG